MNAEKILENSKKLEIGDIIESVEPNVDDFLLEFHSKRPFYYRWILILRKNRFTKSIQKPSDFWLLVYILKVSPSEKNNII